MSNFDKNLLLYEHMYFTKEVSWNKKHLGEVSSDVNITNKSVALLINPPCPNPGRREKIDSNFYFLTSLRYLKMFYEGLKGLHEIFCGTTKKCENKNLSFILI